MKLEQRYGHWGPLLFPEVWELLKMYTVVVNERLRSQGLPAVSQIKVMGAICSDFLLAIQSGIINDYNEAVRKKQLNYPTSRIAARANELAKLTSARGPAISYLPGARRPGCDEYEGDGEPSSFGPLRWNSRGPDPLGRGLPEEPGKVRRRVPRSPETSRVWGSVCRSIERTRQTFAESGYLRLSPNGATEEEGDNDQEARGDDEGETSPAHGSLQQGEGRNAEAPPRY